MFKRISHFGIVVNDVDAAEKLWCGVFGFEKFDEVKLDVEGLHSVFIAVPGQELKMTIELMEPLNKDDMNNPVARYLKKRGEGFYHLCGVVDDIDGTAQHLQEAGLEVRERPPLTPEDDPRWLTHPRTTNGVMVEGIREWSKEA